jgi:uncharacterized protein YciI
MLYLRVCFDRPGMGALRNKLRAEHRAYLKPFVESGSSVRLVQAGPMCISDTDDTNLGSFMIVEASSAEEVRRFHDADPFALADIFGRVEICRWDKHIG